MNGPDNPIGWCDYTWNPVTGCRHGCRFNGARCYAEGIARRFAGSKAHPNGFEPTFHERRLLEPSLVKTPSRIFAVSMGDLFGEWVPREWIHATLEAIRRAPWHTFILLTKSPAVAAQWPMPENVWLGSTITGALTEEARRLDTVRGFQARIRFLSLEPLSGPVDVSAAAPDWVIVGGATGVGAFQPEEAWVLGLERYAHTRGLPVYHKDNLTCRRAARRREWPDGQSATQRGAVLRGPELNTASAIPCSLALASGGVS